MTKQHKTTESICPRIKEMNICEVIEFPLIRLKSVRVLTSELAVILKRKYTTHVDRERDIISVKRLA
jgi:hypothetical protein